jgi:hypothetical protein
VATSLVMRVRQLEGGGGGKCPACGFDGNWSKVRVVVNRHTAHKRNRYCETCGRPTHIVLTWGGEHA